MMPVVRLERPRPHIALVTIDRPDARNSINRQVREELAAVVSETEADRAIRVVVLTGAGNKAFCAGADLREVADGHMPELFTPEGGFASFTHSARRKPWIAAVNGAVVAGGCEIALACEMIIAGEHAFFGLPEPKRGLIAAGGGIYRIARALPRNMANELVLTGKTIPASEAYRLGLVNDVVAVEAVLDRALLLAEEIARNAARAVEESLMILRAADTLDENALQRLSEERLAAIGETADFQEGINAFLEKRGAVWSSL